MEKIKYEDKLNAIKNRKVECKLFKIKGNSLDEVIEEIYNSKKYSKIKDSLQYIIINIESLDDDSWVYGNDIMRNGMDMNECKRIASSISTYRYLGLSPDLSEIYFERIDINMDEVSPVSLFFDYGLIYGNYDEISYGELINIPWELSNHRYTSIYRIVGIESDSSKLIDIEDVSNGLFYMYFGNLLDSEGNYITSINEVSDPIPVSLIYKYIERGN